ncbi:hypothetical protein B0T22DRAFT_448824 [Podospora appendiculata]|uniref:Uncharacterized protein n=1 Tax=Podospora appendiculata TaxID=314037 RepID=A0AAE1CFU7_9PEZI|nr:hypothetical protein B0T22DRAFT_448824 [Podospora appendiculata]
MEPNDRLQLAPSPLASAIVGLTGTETDAELMERFPTTHPDLIRILQLCYSMKDEGTREAQHIKQTVATSMSNMESDLSLGMTHNTSTLRGLAEGLETTIFELEKERSTRKEIELRLEKMEQSLEAAKKEVGTLRDEHNAEKRTSHMIRNALNTLYKILGIRLVPSHNKDSSAGKQPDSKHLHKLECDRVVHSKKINKLMEWFEKLSADDLPKEDIQAFIANEKELQADGMAPGGASISREDGMDVDGV